MFKFALKSMFARKVITTLFISALVVASTISMVSVNIASQVQEGFFKADSQYDVIVGPNGSATQLVLSTLFYADEPVGTIDYSVVEKLEKQGNLQKVVPFGLGDNYRGAKIIGTSPDFLEGSKYDSGKIFEAEFEAVVGYNVAKAYDLKAGSTLISSHGVMSIGHEHSNKPYTVVGILKETKSAIDNVVVTDIASIWEAHETHEDGEEHPDEEGEGHHDEEAAGEEHHDEERQVVTAILIRSGSLLNSNTITSEYNKGETQAINPTKVMRNLLENIDLSKQVATLLTGIILLLAFLIVIIMTVLMLDSIGKEIKTLRFIGISRGSIAKYVIYQTLVLASSGAVISIALSRVALYVSNIVSTKLGIVIDVTKFYSIEVGSLLVIVLLCISPVAFYLGKAFKEALSNEN